jgi:hypothetical protein
MATRHSLRIDFDESSGAVAAVHRCTVDAAGIPVSHSREIDLGADAAAALKGVLDANRELVEREATGLAISHAAAVSGKVQPGVKKLAVGGSLGALGGSEAKKVETKKAE